MPYPSELEGLYANQGQYRRYDDREPDLMQLSLADMEGSRRANQAIEAKYAPIYAEIEQQRKREQEREAELEAAPLQDRQRELALQRLEPATPAEINEIGGITGPLTRGEAIAEIGKKRAGEGAMQRDILKYRAEVEAAGAAHPLRPLTPQQENAEEEQYHAATITRLIQRMRQKGLSDDDISAAVSGYMYEKAPQYRDRLIRSFYPKSLENMPPPGQTNTPSM